MSKCKGIFLSIWLMSELLMKLCTLRVRYAYPIMAKDGTNVKMYTVTRGFTLYH